MLILFLFTGCRYTFTTFLPSNIKTIYIAPVDDQTGGEIPYHLDAQTQITFWLKEKFLEDNRLRIVDRGRADAILEVDIIHYEDVEKLLEGEYSREIAVTLKVSFKDTHSGKILWEDHGLTEGCGYTFNPEEDDRSQGENLAFQVAGGKLVDEILQLAVYGW